MIVFRPRPGFLLSHPAHLIAFGFGAGLAPFAPGTFGNRARLGDRLAASAPCILRRSWLLAARVCSWSACGRAKSPAATSASPTTAAMVWDEVVAFLLVLAIVPRELAWQAAAFVAVPLLRHRQAAADPPAGAALRRRLRRDVRRPGRRRLCPAAARPREEAVLLMDELAKKLGQRLKAQRAEAGHRGILHRRMGGAGRHLGRRLLRLVRARLRHLFERFQARPARGQPAPL